jgi:hypothetical protein
MDVLSSIFDFSKMPTSDFYRARAGEKVDKR